MKYITLLIFPLLVAFTGLKQQKQHNPLVNTKTLRYSGSAMLELQKKHDTAFIHVINPHDTGRGNVSRKSHSNPVTETKDTNFVELEGVTISSRYCSTQSKIVCMTGEDTNMYVRRHYEAPSYTPIEFPPLDVMLDRVLSNSNLYRPTGIVVCYMNIVRPQKVPKGVFVRFDSLMKVFWYKSFQP